LQVSKRAAGSRAADRQRQIGRVEHGDADSAILDRGAVDGSLSDCTREPFTVSSSTPSVTKNNTSCGVSPAMRVPPPGFGMIEMICVIAFV
jgi:hypothetical protein